MTDHLTDLIEVLFKKLLIIYLNTKIFLFEIHLKQDYYNCYLTHARETTGLSNFSPRHREALEMYQKQIHKFQEQLSNVCPCMKHRKVTYIWKKSNLKYCPIILTATLPERTVYVL